MHPQHHFIVKRTFNGEWGNLTEDCTTFDAAVEALMEGFRDNTVTDWPGVTTIFVQEIDGSVALDRTADAIMAVVAKYEAGLMDGSVDEPPFAWSDLVKVECAA